MEQEEWEGSDRDLNQGAAPALARLEEGKLRKTIFMSADSRLRPECKLTATWSKPRGRLLDKRLSVFQRRIVQYQRGYPAFRMLYLLVLAGVILSVLTFNMAPEHSQIFSDPTGDNDSYFGFSVVLLEGTEPRLVVGAPRGHSKDFSSVNATRPGIIYFCSLDNNTACEQVLPGKPEDFLELTNTEDIYLGASLDVQNKGTGLVACAPRWSFWFNDTRCSDAFCLLGLCYFMKDARKEKEVEQLNQKVDPNDLVINKGTRKYMIYRQAGMSVQFVQNGQEVIMGAVGIDRGNGGILRFRDTDNEHVTAVLYPYSNQRQVTDNYFGYSVGSGKFRKDKILYVGSAPRAADYKGKVFVLDIVGNNHEVIQEIDGRQMGEYFGTSLSIVDLNGDGLDDLLVGAPLHYVASSWDTGAVYVLMNNAKDGELREKFKISGNDEAGARFGMSISAIGDINKDGYVDVAVGAPYESDGRGAVYLYHGSEEGINPRYKQRLTAAISFDLKGFGMSISRGLDVDGNFYNDVAVGAYSSANAVLIRSYPVVIVHPHLSASVFKVTPDTTSFTITCCLSYEEAVTSNMKLEPIEISNVMELDKTYERALSKSGKKQYQFSQIVERPGEQNCKDFLVYLQPPRGTQYNSKPIHISVKCTVPVQSRKEFCKNCPVVDPEREIRSELKIPVDLLCGNKAQCLPDLVLRAEFVNIISPYVIGSTNTISIKIRLKNKMEPAYNTQFNVSVSEACRFRRVPAICQVFTRSRLMCTLDTPLLQNEKFSLDLELDVSNLPTNFSLLQVNITAESLGSEQNVADNYVQLSLPVKHDIDILMRGKSEPAQVIYQGEDSEEERLVSHIYEIHNFGMTSAREIQVEVLIPIAVCINTTFVNVVSLNSSQNIMDGPIFRCAVEDVNTTGNCQGNTSDTAAVLHLDCDMINVQCTRVVCSGGPLPSPKGYQAVISFRPELERVKTLLDKNNIVLQSVAQTTILDFANSLDDRVLTESVRTVFQWKEDHSYYILVIVGAALGGLVLLLIISFILYRLGFFKRKKKMPEQQALLNKNDTPNEN